MESDMTIMSVKEQIQQLIKNGDSLNKKKVKQSHPQLLKNALYYFPSWDRAIESSEELT